MKSVSTMFAVSLVTKQMCVSDCDILSVICNQSSIMVKSQAFNYLLLVLLFAMIIIDFILMKAFITRLVI
jgi:hypothetical protein